MGTTGSQTFSIFLYADELIEWTTGDRDGGFNGLGGDPADIGFVDDLGSGFFIPISNTDDVISADDTSNVGAPGIWIFQIDGSNIVAPGLLRLLSFTN